MGANSDRVSSQFVLVELCGWVLDLLRIAIALPVVCGPHGYLPRQYFIEVAIALVGSLSLLNYDFLSLILTF